MHRPGPGSLVWQRLADDRGLLIGGATLVLQVAEPSVGAGVEQHSQFPDQPWRRLYATVMSLATIVYGTSEQAAAEAQRLRQLHRTIQGVDARGRRYAALRPAPWAWVHGTLAWSVIRLNELFRTPFTAAEVERYWREWLEVGRLLGVRAGDLPDSYAGFRAVMDAAARDTLEDNRSVRAVLDAVSAIPAPGWLARTRPAWQPLIGRPLGSLMRVVTIGALPASVAELLELRLTPDERRSLDRFTGAVAGLRRAVPPPLRPGPGALLIQLRSRRQWDLPDASHGAA